MKLRNKIICGALALATYAGTFRNNSGIPLVYNNITRDSYGICLGLINRVDENTTYNGVSVGIVNYNLGKFQGASIGGLNTNSGKINGVEVSVTGNISEGKNAQVNGLEAGLLANLWVADAGEPSQTRGIQLGILNATKTPEDCLQIGFKRNPAEEVEKQ